MGVVLVSEYEVYAWVEIGECQRYPRMVQEGG